MKRYWFKVEETRVTRFYVDAENEEEAYDMADEEAAESDWDSKQYEVMLVKTERR